MKKDIRRLMERVGPTVLDEAAELDALEAEPKARRVLALLQSRKYEHNSRPYNKLVDALFGALDAGGGYA